MPVLEARAVDFAYGRRLALHTVSLTVAPGEMLAIAGPNGSGKSTLLALLAGLRRPSRGTVLLDGRDLRHWERRAVARRLAVVPQETSVVFPYTVAEMVLMGRAAHRGPLGLESARDVAIAEQAMASTGVGDLAARRVTEVSGGERQRVILARALAQEPAVLLLDEPTTHLDLRNAVEILARIAEQNRARGTTVVAVLHDLTAAALYFHRLVFLHEGRVAASGPPAEIIDPTTIQAVFGVAVQVTRDADGVPAVRPPRPKPV